MLLIIKHHVAMGITNTYFKREIDFLGKIELLVAVMIVIFIVLINTIEILGRYIFSNPLGWAQELSTYLIGWFTFFSVSILIKKKDLITINIFYDNFSNISKKIITIGQNITLVIATIIMIKYSFELEKVQRTRELITLNLPQSIGLYGFIIASFSIILTISIFLYKDIFVKLSIVHCCM